MRLHKMNSNGNSFLVLDNRSTLYSLEALSSFARAQCDIHKGIGADGLLVLEDSENPDLDFTMLLFNADGSEAGMCGNGAKCLAKYAWDIGVCKNKALFATKSGNIRAEIYKDNVKITPEPIDLSTLKVIDQMTYLHVLVPHVVIEAKEDNYEHSMITGKALNNGNPLFPMGTNVNFASYVNKNTLKVHTYERGVNGITDSCGTGAMASVLVTHLKYGLDSPVKVIHPGGVNTVSFEINTLNQNAFVSLEGIVYYNSKNIEI